MVQPYKLSYMNATEYYWIIIYDEYEGLNIKWKDTK